MCILNIRHFTNNQRLILVFKIANKLVINCDCKNASLEFSALQKFHGAFPNLFSITYYSVIFLHVSFNRDQ